MKKIILYITIAGLLSGCAHLNSLTTTTTKDGQLTTTVLNITTLFDGQAAVAKAANHVSGTNSGTYVAGVDESSSTTTNFNSLIGTVVAAAVGAAK